MCCCFFMTARAEIDPDTAAIVKQLAESDAAPRWF